MLDSVIDTEFFSLRPKTQTEIETKRSRQDQDETETRQRRDQDKTETEIVVTRPVRHLWPELEDKHTGYLVNILCYW